MLMDIIDKKNYEDMGVGGGGIVVEGDQASLAFGCSVMSKGQNWTFGVYGLLTFIPMWKKFATPCYNCL